jgi:hypothetical protein
MGIMRALGLAGVAKFGGSGLGMGDCDAAQHHGDEGGDKNQSGQEWFHGVNFFLHGG